MNDDGRTFPQSRHTPPPKRKRNFIVLITFIVLPVFSVCFLLGLIGRASFNGLIRGWRIRP